MPQETSSKQVGPQRTTVAQRCGERLDRDQATPTDWHEPRPGRSPGRVGDPTCRSSSAPLLYMTAADKAGLPADRPFRDALRSHVEFGSRVAMRNSHARGDDELHPLREVPKWRWEGA